MLPPPPRSTLFPYTTLFRSAALDGRARARRRHLLWRRQHAPRSVAAPVGPPARGRGHLPPDPRARRLVLGDQPRRHRSEERRVGKEWRSWRPPADWKKQIETSSN